jgi:hypothetical protein
VGQRLRVLLRPFPAALAEVLLWQGALAAPLALGLPEEPEHLPFGSSPLLVAVVFGANGAIAVAAECWSSIGIAPGVLAGFSLYMIAVEEIHWRIHLGGWLPTGLNWTRQYHLAHHDIPSGRFNVFFPVFDLLFGNIKPRLRETQAPAMAATVCSRPSEAPSWPPGFIHAALHLWLLGLAVGTRFLGK